MQAGLADCYEQGLVREVRGPGGAFRHQPEPLHVRCSAACDTAGAQSDDVTMCGYARSWGRALRHAAGSHCAVGRPPVRSQQQQVPAPRPQYRSLPPPYRYPATPPGWGVQLRPQAAQEDHGGAGQAQCAAGVGAGGGAWNAEGGPMAGAGRESRKRFRQLGGQ